MLIDTVTVGLFGLVAVATGHEHWLKEQPEVIPITGPLKAWVDQLPAKTLKKLEQNLAPTLLVVGLATVVGPDAVAEMRLRADEKRLRVAVSGTPAGRNGAAVPAQTGVPPGPPSPDGRARSANGWFDGIPSGPPISPAFDA